MWVNRNFSTLDLMSEMNSGSETLGLVENKDEGHVHYHMRCYTLKTETFRIILIT
jgi:hypothetical protein